MQPEEMHLVKIKRELDDMTEKNTLNKRRMLDLLDKLSSAQVDTELLQRTQVGRSVNNVRKVYASSNDISQKATKLIKQWKHLVKAEHESRRMSVSSVQSDDGSKTSGNGGSEFQASSPSTVGGDDGERDCKYSPVLASGGDDHVYFNFSSSASSVSSKKTLEEDGPPPAKLKRNNSTSSTSSFTSTSGSGGALAKISKPEDETRLKSVELLRQALLSGDAPPPKPHPKGKTSLDVAIEIEHYIFEEIGNVNDRHYKARIRSRVTNLRDRKNCALRNDVLTGKLPAKRLAVMSVDELANDQLKELRRSMEEESIRSREIGTDVTSARTDMYQCDQCGKRDTSYSVTQERVEGDYEPVAITQIVCNLCGHRWRD